MRDSTSEPPPLEEVRSLIEKRLFVGRLPKTADEGELREVFGGFGQVVDIRLLPSKGIAFVTYNTWAAPHRAIISTDQQEVLENCRGQGIAVNFAEQSKAAGRGGAGHLAKGLPFTQVSLRGLPRDLSEIEFRTTLETYGNVDECHLEESRDGLDGVAKFSLWGEALDCVEELDGQFFPGDSRSSRKVSVQFVSQRASRQGGYDRVRERDRFDGRDRRDDRSRPYESSSSGRPVLAAHKAPQVDATLDALKIAYMTALDTDGSAALCTELHEKIMRQSGKRGGGGARGGMGGGRGTPELQGIAKPAVMDDRDAGRLFVGGLPNECTDDELKALVSQLSFSVPPRDCEILECRVLTGKGCGYLRFSSWQAAQEAIDNLNDRAVDGWPLPLRVRWATPKGGGGGGPPGGGGGGGGGGATENVSRALQDIFDELGDSVSTDNLPGGGDEFEISNMGLDPRRLFVGQLSRDVRDKAILHALFEPFGEIEHIKWLQDKGVCYVQYRDFTPAATAVATLDRRVMQNITTKDGLNIKFSKISGGR
eukprot:TRINITY_DN12675_c0_g1_i1.p1 TRINITY_DN12675_c0_g1~~TRINITY_DN12675_c0_g1_i1.p1  ORF type:complete len:565 (+),score=133.66 TRINITY_DN12675_c0_g1_i1:82-1695(+)